MYIQKDHLLTKVDFYNIKDYQTWYIIIECSSKKRFVNEYDRLSNFALGIVFDYQEIMLAFTDSDFVFSCFMLFIFLKLTYYRQKDIHTSR
jgi:hypothetical protein